MHVLFILSYQWKIRRIFGNFQYVKLGHLKMFDELKRLLEDYYVYM